MGARFPLLLQPNCPSMEDPVVAEFLHLSVELCSASWAELVLEPVRSSSARTYHFGKPGSGGSELRLQVGDEFFAVLRVGSRSTPDQQTAEMLSTFLETILERELLRTQSSILGAALDASWSSVMVFDAAGNILYANPPADRLLSLLTEDELLAEIDGESPQPLFTLLCSLVERVVTPDSAEKSWKGTIRTADGRVLSGNVDRLSEPETGTQPVLVHLQQAPTEPGLGIDAFSALHNLSRREREVVQLLRDGLTTGAMAEHLSISPHTVRDHLKNLYKKTNANSRGELLGLISRTSRSPVAADSD